MTIDQWRLFWAKTNRKSTDGLPTRPLWAHLIDVASVAELLWDRYLPRKIRGEIEASLNLSPDQAKSLFIFFCALHDVGKGIPAFQYLHRISGSLLNSAGLPIHISNRKLHHGFASISILYCWICERKFSKEVLSILELMAAFAGFHHGRLQDRGTWQKNAGSSSSSTGILGNRDWRRAQLDLINEIELIYHPPFPTNPLTGRKAPYWLLATAGLTTLSDWAGSMARRFPEIGHDGDLKAYQAASQNAAEKAIRAVHLDDRSALQALNFQQLFPEITFPPRDLQRNLESQPLAHGNIPTLTIIEAPTGEGKTEGAFCLSARQQAAGENKGLFIAMPTQATSEQLFERFGAFLHHAHDPSQGHASVRLVHGNALLHTAFASLVERRDRGEDEAWEEIFDVDENPDRTKAQVGSGTWFLEPRMSLLVPYGVATVDQMLLGILYSKHFFVRLLGLSGKTIIFDEVHAYDHYMTELFRRLLQWLHALGCHVILLSATLPTTMQRKLVTAWTGKPDEHRESEENTPYPVIWTVAGDQVQSQQVEAHQQRHVTISWSSPDPEQLALEIVTEALRGGTIGVIVNTVDRAQKIYSHVVGKLDKADRNDIDVSIFHARFTNKARKQIQDRVCERFGKDRPMNKPAILIATQVAEQSLNFDFDLLFTDLAPIDLLLQRDGRKHRYAHLRRPAGFEIPKTVILCPTASPRELPDVSDIGGTSVYDTIVIWKTWRTLTNRSSWRLPEDYRPLIHAVYDTGNDVPTDLSEPAQKDWTTAREEAEERAIEAETQAYARLIPEPGDLKEMILSAPFALTDEEDNEVHRQLRAVTRLGPESIEAICLHWYDGVLYFDRDRTRLFDPSTPLTNELVRDLLHCSVRLSNKAVVAFLKKNVDPIWAPLREEHRALRYRHLLVFENGIWQQEPKYHIHFDTMLGLVIHKKEECSWPDLT